LAKDQDRLVQDVRFPNLQPHAVFFPRESANANTKSLPMHKRATILTYYEVILLWVLDAPK
jgi:hypothetical protein